MTRAQLLASLGARDLRDDQLGLQHRVEDAATGVGMMAEVNGNSDGSYVEAVIYYRDATRPGLPVCIFQALATAGRFTASSFVVGDVPYVQCGQWSVFTEADACAFVRAVMRELEAKRLPDLDKLLSGATTASGGPISIGWR